MGFLDGGDLFLLVVSGGANALSGAADTVFTQKANSISSVIEAFFWGVMTC